ncbi:terminase GpA [Hyphomicrobium denitrificans ATCC 51888]|uniref:Terminase GpA n=1 Tax=Hyphomicrobium denitrificans (strain ATCC 51888 / DSM 1869 / NCIMB 11706 / TK 0415) TaxID=582899 RepID=D8JWB6_HYPDA|nr:terminase gpA endonuclease subunit [Hyphomicrobium denitrificans]ADJ23029.1 terminase GpA [Hyphomicrobium denitrificans ATCC 51888]
MLAGVSEAIRSVVRLGWVEGLELPPRLKISQWADEHRHIAAGTGPEPGHWNTDRTPFAREPMDAACDPDVEIIVLEWSSQVGKTEVLLNAACYYIDQDPSPQMFVLPDLNLAESFSTNRFSPTVEASPRLLERIGRARSRDSDQKKLEKSYAGGDIVFAGANSASSLASRPRRIVIFDEIDKYKASIGNDGDPIKQGFQRTQNFWNRKKFLASTPTIEGASAIDAWFLRSDQRYFEVPCPHCGLFQALEWESVKWDKGKPETARYHCGHTDEKTGEIVGCGEPWDQRQVLLAVRKGLWKARAPFNGVAGFKIWAIYSPWVSMADLVKEWEDCEGKPAEEQTFWNLKLGRVYNPSKKAKTTPQELFDRREDYGPSSNGYVIPDEVLAITAGVDVQADRFECQYIGWAAGDEKFVLDHVIHYDDPTAPGAFERMEQALLFREFDLENGETLAVESVAIDAGNWFQVVMEFVRASRAAFKPYYATKGKDGAGRQLMRESESKFKLGAKLHLIGVDDGKTMLYHELAVVPDEKAGIQRYRVHFPKHLELKYFEQLVSETLKIDYRKGRPVRVWMPPAGGKRNEALDTFIYAMAARAPLAIDYDQRRADRQGTARKVDGALIASFFKR